MILCLEARNAPVLCLHSIERGRMDKPAPVLLS